MYRLCNLKNSFFALVLILALFASGGFTAIAEARESVVLSWDRNPEPDIAGYRVRYGQTSGNLDESCDTRGPSTEIPVSGLLPGETYYFAVRAYNRRGVEGPLSNEISYAVPRARVVRPAPQIMFPELVVESSSGGPLSPSQAFGPTQITNVGSKSVLGTITLHNRGKANLNGLTLNLKGASAFSVSELNSTTLAAGESIELVVNFTPETAGQQSAVLQISSNDPAHPRFDVVLAASGVPAPAIAVFRAWGNPITPESVVAFGNLELGSTTGRLPLTIRNVGSASLKGLHAMITGAGAADFTHSPFSVDSLAPGASTTIQVMFDPKREGTTSASLLLTGDDAPASGFKLTLTGTGVGVPQVAVFRAWGNQINPESVVAFGNLELGSATGRLPLTIRNVGTAPLSGLLATIAGPGAAAFTHSPISVNTLAPGASTTIQLVFDPKAVGSTSATLHLTGDGATASGFQLTLTGTGVGVAHVDVAETTGSHVAVHDPVLAPSATLFPAVATSARPTEGIEVIGGQKYNTLTISSPPGFRVSAHNIQVSSDRVDWTSGSLHTVVMSDNAHMLKVRDRTPVTHDHKRFIRVKQ